MEAAVDAGDALVMMLRRRVCRENGERQQCGYSEEVFHISRLSEPVA